MWLTRNLIMTWVTQHDISPGQCQAEWENLSCSQLSLLHLQQCGAYSRCSLKYSQMEWASPHSTGRDQFTHWNISVALSLHGTSTTGWPLLSVLLATQEGRSRETWVSGWISCSLESFLRGDFQFLLRRKQGSLQIVWKSSLQIVFAYGVDGDASSPFSASNSGPWGQKRKLWRS